MTKAFSPRSRKVRVLATLGPASSTPEMIEKLHAAGADAFRWYLFTAQSPWESFRFSLDVVDETRRRFLFTLWNTYAFLVTYAALPDGRLTFGSELKALRAVGKSGNDDFINIKGIGALPVDPTVEDRKSTRLNSSHT